MIDLHCHLLPGVDDGPDTWDAALALARACVEDGIRHAVLTPHVFPGRHDNDSTTLQPAFQQFRALLQREGLPLTASLAGEVRLTPEILDMLPEGRLPFLGRSAGMDNLLLELPDGQIPLGTDRLVHRLLRLGVRPILAHPERNRAVIADPLRMRPFVEAGCLLQVTAGSLTGHFGPSAREAAWALLRAGWVAAVASDCHNLGGRRPRMQLARQHLIASQGLNTTFELLAASPARLCGLPQPAAWGPRATEPAIG